jgi:hypothetical protein
MLAILVIIRDALIAMALAWVGVTIEQREPSCAAETCQAQND